ncbi:hypothetical protein PSOS111911_12000 [Pseudoalteromonas ostreae]
MTSGNKTFEEIRALASQFYGSRLWHQQYMRDCENDINAVQIEAGAYYDHKRAGVEVIK